MAYKTLFLTEKGLLVKQFQIISLIQYHHYFTCAQNTSRIRHQSNRPEFMKRACEAVEVKKERMPLPCFKPIDIDKL